MSSEAPADSQILDSRRLSVRNAVEASETSVSAKSDYSRKLAFGETGPDWDEVPFNYGAPELVTVDEGDTRKLESGNDAIVAWKDYTEAKENRVLLLEEQDEGDILVLPHNHRFKEAYRKMTYAKLKAAERHIKRRWGDTCPTTLLTLTARQKTADGEPRAPAEVLKELAGGWDKLRRVLYRETKGVQTEYMAVWEPHQSGYPHLHILLFGTARPSLGEKVRGLWSEKYGIGDKEAQDAEIRKGRSAQIDNPAAYVMKYLSKTLVRGGEKTDNGNCDDIETAESMPGSGGYELFSALLWATGKRHYSMSEGLTAAIQNDRDRPDEFGGNWEFVGTASGVAPGRYSGDRAERLGKHLFRKAWHPLPGFADPNHVPNEKLIRN